MAEQEVVQENLGVPQLHAWTKLRPDEDLTHGRPRQQGSSASACGAIMRGDKIEAIDGYEHVLPSFAVQIFSPLRKNTGRCLSPPMPTFRT